MISHRTMGTAVFLVALFSCAHVRAQVRINEFHAAPNNLILDWDASGSARVGSGHDWRSVEFNDQGWPAGTAPLGQGTGTITNLTSLISGKTPSLYLRKSFSVTVPEAASTAPLTLTVTYDDGFVAYINGKEAARANLGPVRQHIAFNQTTYRAETTASPVAYNLGPAVNWLRAGNNVLAIQVHNSTSLTSDLKVDASLTAPAVSVTTVLKDIPFADANGAAHTHTNLAGAVTNSTQGVPAPGSWLALASAPYSSPLWQSLGIESMLHQTAGRGGGGALQYSLSQTGAHQAASVYGPPVSFASIIPAGSFTAAELDRISLTFSHKVSAAAEMGFELQPTAGNSAAALSGFATLSGTGGSLDSYSNLNGTVRRHEIYSDGHTGNQVSGTGRPAPNLGWAPTFFFGPGFRGGALPAKMRFYENNLAGQGYAASTGAMRYDVEILPATWDYYGFSLPAMEATAIPTGTLLPEHLGDTQLHFAWKLPAGVSYRVYLEPQVAGYAERLDFGTLTGNSAWQVFDASLSSATNIPAALAAINASSASALDKRKFRLVFRGEVAIPSASYFWVDDAGLISPWKEYAINLGANSSPASKTAFVNALNSGNLSSFIPTFTKISSATAPAVDTITLDDFRVVHVSAATGTRTFAGLASSWKYFVGRSEPSGGVIEPAYANDPVWEGDFSDWIELHNLGASAVNLQNWSLTDDESIPAKWVFPSVSIPAGGYLVVLADAPPTPVAGATYLHANFKLASEGGLIALRNPSGQLMSGFEYGRQDSLHTFGQSTAPTGQQEVYFRTGTPGAANSGTQLVGYTEDVEFSIPGGHYTGNQTLELSCITPGAQIYYTTDGADPTQSSPAYTAPLALNFVSQESGHCLRARAFTPNYVPSRTRTQTFLINQHANLKTSPALVVTGDPGRSLFMPYGVTAISGGTRTSDVWSSTGPSDYNNPIGDGRAWERPATMELHYADGRPGISEEVGLRISGSGHARPRYYLTNLESLTPWNLTDYKQKPSFNIWFRNEYDRKSVTSPIFGEDYATTEFEQFRIRAGKNDVRNPFIKDELMRRLFIDHGQHGSLGMIVPFYVNGKFRGYYNMTERLREPFMRQHFKSSGDWDVRQVSETSNGDAVAFTDFIAKLDAYGTNPTEPNYQAAVSLLDLPNYVDYILVNTWGGTGDWPHNNWVISREKTTGAKWRFFVWDAEGAFGGFNKLIDYNVLVSDLENNPTGTNREICRIWSRLKSHIDFRVAFADRIHKHFCNGGAMTDARIRARFDALAAEFQPLLTYTGGGALTTSWFTNWVHDTNVDKRDYLFQSVINATTEAGKIFERSAVWPVTLPPKLSQHGGEVAAAYNLSIFHTEPQNVRNLDNPYKTATSQSPAGRTIYYSLNGTDPRLPGGAVNPSTSVKTYTGTVPLLQSTAKLMARVRNTSVSPAEWSPLTEATFLVGTVPPSASNLVVAEINYHPSAPSQSQISAGFTDQDDFEFLRVKNVGPSPVKLSQSRFTEGIGFDFADGTIPVLDPGASALIVANRAAFNLRYGTAFDPIIAGHYTGSLDNSGEWLRWENSTITNPTTATIRDFPYDDSGAWPASADGKGATLLLLNPSSLPDHSLPVSWIATAQPGGLMEGAGAAISYTRWRDLFFEPHESAISGQLSDADGDGYSNALEFGLGSDPRSRLSIPIIKVTIEDNSGPDHLTIEYTRLTNATGISCVPQISTNLSSWLEGSGHLQYLSSTVHPNGTTTARYRDVFPTSASPSRFVRVKATF